MGYNTIIVTDNTGIFILLAVVACFTASC